MATVITVPTVLLVLPLLALLMAIYFAAAGWVLDHVVAPRLQQFIQNQYARKLRRLGLTEAEIEIKLAEIKRWSSDHRLWPFARRSDRD